MSHQHTPEGLMALRREVAQLEEENRALHRQLRQLEQRQPWADDAFRTRAFEAQSLAEDRRLQEQYLHLVLRNSPDILLLFDETGRFVYATQAFLEATELPGFSAVAGLRFDEAFSTFAPKDWVDRIQAQFAEALSRRKNLVLTEEISLRKDGAPRIYQIHYTPMADDAGAGEGALLVFFDITEPEQARAQAEAANASKSTFLSNMSHEMRTPLNAILGMARIAQETGDPDRIQYCIDQINHAGGHLLEVINDVLDMSKIESGKLELNEAPFAVEDMLRKVAHVIAFRANEKRQRLSLHLAPDVPRALMADEQRLRQVLVNLLSNAVKFTPEDGDIKLSVELLSLSGGLCTLTFTVQDSGIGISKEQLQHLFRPFAQADAGISRRYGSTGLGLVISQRIVRMMHGEIQVDSIPGQGASFSFNVRVRLAPEKPTALHTLPVDWPAIRILVIGDNEEALSAFPQLAEKVGFSCDMAADAYAAQSYLAKEENHYQLVFLDFQTAGSDIFSLLAQVRKARPDAHCIAISGTLDWIEVERQARDAGISWIIFKPFNVSSITDAMANVLGGRPEGGTGGDVPTLTTSAQEAEARRDAFLDKRMLLAEDVEVNREIVHMLLEGSGLAIEFAENGKEALDMYIERPEAFDVIFMDIHMPEMDGYEASRRIRDFEEGAGLHVPIIAVTANVFREDVEKSLEAGMDDHVGKPVRLEEMLEKLHKYLD